MEVKETEHRRNMEAKEAEHRRNMEAKEREAANKEQEHQKAMEGSIWKNITDIAKSLFNVVGIVVAAMMTISKLMSA